MPRMTQKYIAATAIAAAAGVAHESTQSLYGWLQTEGYNWDGKRWKRKNPNAVTVRVLASTVEVYQVVAIIKDALAKNGYDTTSSTSYSSKGSDVRVYFTATRVDDDE